MLRLAMIFAIILIVQFIIEGAVSKFSFYYALILSCIITGFNYLSEILKGLSTVTKAAKTERGVKYNLVSFNDAVADELMKIRLDLIDFKIEKNKNLPLDEIPLGMNNTPDIFLRLYWMCCDYPNNALNRQYKTPQNEWGLIIIILDNLYFYDEEHSNFDAEKLREIKSPKIHKFKTGMNLTVYLYEPKIYLPQIGFLGYSDFEWRAKILSVKEADCEGLVIELEMVRLDLECEEYGDKIRRKISIPGNDAINFISDNKVALSK